MSKEITMGAPVLLHKATGDQRLVWGWASVIEKDGKLIFDHQGDAIPEHVLQKAVHNYVSDYRIAKIMHDGAKVGELVESIVFTKALQKALGIDLGQVGWFIGMRVGEDVYKRIQSGELRAFSIGGLAIRVDADELEDA